MDSLEELLRAWCDAEAGGDAAALAALLAGDFRGDGPLGFVLDKDQWLDRHRRGGMTVAALTWTVEDVRVLNDTAVATGTRSQAASHRGQDRGGAVACTLVAVRREGRWRIVNVQLGTRAS
jgi:hypothetical protein